MTNGQDWDHDGQRTSVGVTGNETPKGEKTDFGNWVRWPFVKWQNVAFSRIFQRLLSIAKTNQFTTFWNYWFFALFSVFVFLSLMGFFWIFIIFGIICDIMKATISAILFCLYFDEFLIIEKSSKRIQFNWK